MADKLMNLREKLHAIYEEIDHVEKAGKNDAQKYKYVKSADVLRVIRESLSKNRVYAETNFEMLVHMISPRVAGASCIPRP